MDLQFRLTRSEYQHMAAHESARHPAVRRRRLFFSLYIAMLAFIATAFLAEAPLLGLFAALFAAGLSVPLFHKSRRDALGRTYDLIASKEDVRVRIDACGLNIERLHIRSEIDWAGITALSEDEVGFYITYGPLQSVYVPRRAFTGAEAAQQFWTTANEYRQFAKPATTPVAVRV